MRTDVDVTKGISIIRDYSRGSKATTILCIDDNSTFYRKYTYGEDIKKLFMQAQWIEQNNDKLPLPKIIRIECTNKYCFYDMPYSSHAVGLFEYAHSMPVEKTWNIIKRAIDRLDSSIYKENIRHSDRESIYEYYEKKVSENLNEIKQDTRIRALQGYENVNINGRQYINLPVLRAMFSEKKLLEVFSEDIYSDIHGDLTLENIICTRNNQGVDDFYLIDPNLENIHETPFLDYAKLLQSVHGGYEFLDSATDIKVSGNNISYSCTYSTVYSKLHRYLKKYISEHFRERDVRSIYYHEMIHWIRLMPYRIKKDKKNAIVFYAVMIMVMNDVFNMFEGGKHNCLRLS